MTELNAAFVKSRAKELGADLAGIASAATLNAFPPDPRWPQTPERISPYCKSVIVLVQRIPAGAFRCKTNVPVQYIDRSLYQRAVGYNYEATKIFMPANREKPVVVPYIEHVPPDVTAGVYWLKNRDPKNWRDTQTLEHVLGKYLISDKPMSEEDWARERADVIDEQTNNAADQPRFGDGREERDLESARRLEKPNGSK
jgi:hypothetical protein